MLGWLVLAIIFVWFTVVAYRLLDKPPLRPMPSEVATPVE
jgi:hypothetical protein